MRISDWSSDVSLPICRAAWHQSGRTLANLPVHERRERRLVETAVAKWCHKRRDGTLKHGIAPSPRPQIRYQDRKSVVSGKSLSVRVDLGGRRIIKKKTA